MAVRKLFPRLVPSHFEMSLPSRVLLGDASEGNQVPRVSLVEVKDGEERWLSDTDPFDECELEARANLLSVQVEWDVRTNESTGQLEAMVGHHTYAASCILSAPHLQELQSYLDVESLAVAIPIHSLLAVQNGNPENVDDLLGLLQWAKYVYEDAEKDGLTPHVFLVQDGDIKAVIQPEEEQLFTEDDFLEE